MLVQDFLNEHAPDIWHGKHLAESQSKVLLFVSVIGDKHLEEVGAPDIIKFDKWLQNEKGICKNTCNHYKAAISALYKYAVEYEAINDDQVPRMKFHKVKSGRVRFFTPVEIKQCYDFFAGSKHTWIKHFFTVGLNTGMRLGEIQSITPDMFYLNDQGDLFVGLKDTKNGDDREVAINEAAKLALDAMDRNPGHHFRHRPFYNAWIDVRRVVFRGDKLACFHVTRHTYASTLVNTLEVNHLTVMDLMGHKDPKTTKKYVHADTSKNASINNKMASLYASAL